MGRVPYPHKAAPNAIFSQWFIFRNHFTLATVFVKQKVTHQGDIV